VTNLALTGWGCYIICDIFENQCNYLILAQSTGIGKAFIPKKKKSKGYFSNLSSLKRSSFDFSIHFDGNN
jgi:hypothetical protein